MGYVFKQEQSIAHNIQRILTEQALAARQALDNPGQDKGDAIHTVRKRIKKSRALLRLVKSELKKDIFKQANTHYRTIGQTLSPLRDATVMIKTLEKLRQLHPQPIAPAVIATLHKSLAHQQDQISQAFFEESSTIEVIFEALRVAPLRISGLGKHQRSFSIIRPNLEAIYRRGRKALHLASQEATIHNLHELRKEVKTLGYHTRLLEPIWPGLIKSYGYEFGQLGELLGDDHDFGVLALEIESDRLLLRNQQSKERISQVLHQQRTILQRKIFPLANRLFAQKADAFVGQYRLYWKIWQKEAEVIR
jgi:CHAD domain-containing protein